MIDKPDSGADRSKADDSGLHHLSEDTTGFGQRELRTVRDAFARPAAMLEAYMTRGPTGGGEYARPLRFYLTLCGILMLQLFLMGGTKMVLAGLPPEVIDPLVAQSGKSRELFLSDADNWMSLVLVPINAVFYALVSAPLLRWWDHEDLGWRRAFRGTFHYLNVWTLPFVPIGFLAYVPATMGWMTVVMIVLSFVAFLRIGKGRWYRSTLGGVLKAVVITTVTFLGTGVAYVPVMAIGLLGGVLG
jgi:acyl-CoA synthetase (AMP-forming)/AMP-acid ligase II